MVTAILWQGVPLDLPHPSGYLIYGLGFAPWLRIAVAFPRRSLAEGTTLDVISLLVWRKQRWVERAGWFWSNVLFVGGLGGWAGCSGVWMLWVGLLDLATLVRLWLTGPA